MAEGTNMHGLKYDKHDVSILQNRGPNNIAININKYIAKYDFEIADKIKPPKDGLSSEDEKVEIDERPPPLSEAILKKKFAQNTILEILQLCTNNLSRDNRCYESIWTLDG